VLHGGYLYFVNDRGRAFCLKADTGELAGETPLPISSRGNSIYASVLLADGRLYAVSRRQGAFVLKATPDLPLIAHNRLDSDSSEFNASPAASNGELFLRSDQMLYCLSRKTGR
jgi:outer membrane protein assembly factor BamB